MTGSKDNPGQIAAFFYRGRNNFYATPQALSWSMFVDQFEGHTDIEGVFYRFMPSYPDATKDELVEFIKQYMDQAPKRSGGIDQAPAMRSADSSVSPAVAELLAFNSPRSLNTQVQELSSWGVLTAAAQKVAADHGLNDPMTDSSAELNPQNLQRAISISAEP